VVSSTPRPHFTRGKDPYSFYRRLVGPQGRSGRAENLVHTGIRSRTVQPVAQSLYRLSYPDHCHLIFEYEIKEDETCGSWNKHKMYDKLVWMFRPEAKCLLPRILRPFIYRLFDDVIYSVLVGSVNTELVKTRKENAIALFLLPHQNLHVEEIAGETLAA